MSDEIDILTRLRAGDPGAYEALVRVHGGRMLAVARRLVRNEADAQDCVQEAFLQAFRSIAGFEGRSELGTWLHRIVVNAALGRIRSRTRRAERSLDDLLPEFDAQGGRLELGHEGVAAPEVLVAADELRQHVHHCIDQLPESFRNILILRDIEGYDTRETATLVGARPATVKTRLHRARAALKTLLERATGEGEL